MTTRKPAPTRPHRLFIPAVLAIALLLLGGCATPGPNQGYYITDDDRFSIVQFDPALPDAPTRSQSSHLTLLQAPFGFAYDPFTDHFFIRLNPGNRFLVVDRPDRSIKRAFRLSGLTLPPGTGDIAIRSRDRHLFITHPHRPEVFETNLDGEFVRTIQLDELDARPDGLAYDQIAHRLLTLHAGHVETRDLDGRVLARVRLDHPVTAGGLAYDSATGEYFAPLSAPAGGLGVFANDGRLLRTISLPPDAGQLAFDVGPRSLLRLF